MARQLATPAGEDAVEDASGGGGATEVTTRSSKLSLVRGGSPCTAQQLLLLPLRWLARLALALRPALCRHHLRWRRERRSSGKEPQPASRRFGATILRQELDEVEVAPRRVLGGLLRSPGLACRVRGVAGAIDKWSPHVTLRMHAYICDALCRNEKQYPMTYN